jgi:hypothetical protein
VLGVTRPLRKCHFSIPKLLDTSVVAITKNVNFFENDVHDDSLKTRTRYSDGEVRMAKKAEPEIHMYHFD